MRRIALSLVLLAACTGGPQYTEFDAGPDVDADQDAIDAAIDAPVIDAAVDAVPADAPAPDAPPVGPIIQNGQDAELVLGQPNFTSATANNGGVSAHSLEWPSGIATDGTYLWVIDSGNHRAMRWEPLPLTNNADSDQVLGQTTLTNGSDPGATASAATLRIPNSVEIDGTTLLVPEGNRVLIWTSLPTSNGQAANRVLCQTTFTAITSGNSADKCSAPTDVWTDGTRLAVADKGNNRVLIWTTFPTANGEPADVVLGQTGFGVSTTPSSATASNMYWPQGVYFDGSRFYVADTLQNRVLVWNGFPTTNNEPADFVIGQPNLTSKDAATSQSGVNRPRDVVVVGDALFVSDMANDRVMVWSPIPTTSGVPASYVLGPDDFTTAGGSPAATPSSLDGPMGLTVAGDKLFVVDYEHHRVLRFGLNVP